MTQAPYVLIQLAREERSGQNQRGGDIYIYICLYIYIYIYNIYIKGESERKHMDREEGDDDHQD